ncbi:Fasciclin-like arabinogalactan protein 11 [Linum grandiflorum]
MRMQWQTLLVTSLLFLHQCSTLAQDESPAAAPAAGQLGPINVVKILKKAGHFKVFVRLLKTTQLDSNLNSQLDDTNNGITILAPSDAAFAKLKRGTQLGSLTRQEKLQLAQFHIIPVFISRSEFESVSSPIPTHAGSGDLLQLNVTAASAGSNAAVNLTTGVTNTTLSDTVYMDDTHLAIYQVDSVLLPMSIVGDPKAEAASGPVPAAAEDSSSADGDASDDDNGDDDSDDGSDGDGVSKKRASAGVGVNVMDSNVFMGFVCAAFLILALPM